MSLFNATETVATTNDANNQSTSIWAVLAALLLPLLVNSLLNESQQALVARVHHLTQLIQDWLDGTTVTRDIERSEQFDRNGYSCGALDADDRNEILINAILAYCSANPAPATSARVSLLAGPDDVSSEEEQYSAAGELRKLAVTTRPAPDDEVLARAATATEPDVYLTLSRSAKAPQAKGSGEAKAAVGKTTVTTTIHLKASGKRGAAAIEAFVDDAFRAHAARVKAKEDAAGRFMFAPIPASENSWKRYRLSGDKTFDTLFFREKRRVLQAIDDFEAKAGKYEIPGFPHKLGLLLHGPPGTGKTSLIKAIAAKTKRHVINVRLSQVGTNAKLCDWLFDGKFQVDEDTVKVPVDKCVFVFEDIDCVSDVVLARAPTARSASAPVEDVAVDSSKPGPASADDRLSLAGLLNALDGVVDAPGRIVIMTSNHPEKLDPALVRPGRVNLKLYLGYVDAAAAREMCAHYFGAADAGGDAVAAAIEALAAEAKEFSPAQLEHLCAAHESAAALAEELSAGLLRVRREKEGRAAAAAFEAAFAAEHRVEREAA
eukprot:CAMPEP_0119269292 /NCGR_PEP_ID=MMETSP1329-20130426/6756_1 /TAXON_ID=114041 /ORGANISM="Genus nov. species nov., Strain RCC1024" /LENGTH=546 /DNA_ID=CAMNT_0007269289 /DNA_START=58 /DNA_END=1694 /DNA_ORIENTATION=-